MPHIVQDAGVIYREQTRQKSPSFQGLCYSQGKKRMNILCDLVCVLSALDKHGGRVRRSGVRSCNFRVITLEQVTEPLSVPLL